MPTKNSNKMKTRLMLETGAAIRRLRVAAGWSQEELSRRVGMKRSYISRVESGHANVTLGTCAQLFGAFGVGLEIRLVLEQPK